MQGLERALSEFFFTDSHTSANCAAKITGTKPSMTRLTKVWTTKTSRTVLILYTSKNRHPKIISVELADGRMLW